MKITWILLSGLFTALAAYFTYWSVMSLYLGWSSSSWPQVQATIERSRIDTYHGEDYDSYTFEVDYRYEVNGEEFEGDSASFSDISAGERENLQSYLDTYVVGSQHTVYYNPEQLQQSVLIPGTDGLSWFLLLVCIFWFLFGLGFLIMGFCIDPKKAGRSGYKPYFG